MKFRIDLRILFFLALFFFTKQIKIYLIVMFFAMIHELVHAIIGSILGFKLQSFEILPFGFHINLIPNEMDYNKRILKSNMVDLKYIFISLAGPIFNLALAIIFSKMDLNIDKYINSILIYSNLLIFAFNLILIYPLDGGRVIKSFFNIFLGEKITYKTMKILSNITIFIFTFAGSVAILYFKNIAILIILLYLWILFLKERD